LRAAERGRDQYKHYRRNVAWQKVSEQLRGVLPRDLVIGFMLFTVLLKQFLILLKL
jgi:hypothetical protein